MKNIILIGDGGHANSVIEIIKIIMILFFSPQKTY